MGIRAFTKLNQDELDLISSSNNRSRNTSLKEPTYKKRQKENNRPSVDEIYDHLSEFSSYSDNNLYPEPSNSSVKRMVKSSDVNKKRNKAKKADRNSEDFYENRYSDSDTLLVETMDETNSLLDESRDFLTELKSNRKHTTFKAITDQTANVTTLLSTKLNIIKEMNNVKKNISDLELKRLKDSKANEENNDDAMIEKIFDKLMNSNISEQVVGDLPISKKHADKYMNKPYYDEALADSVGYDEYEEDGRYYMPYANEEDNIDEIIENRLYDLRGNDNWTETEIRARYEGAGIEVEIAIEKDMETREWNFIAIDEDGNVLEDYPVPKKSSRKVTFNDEKETARDTLGNKYRVFFI